VVIGAGSNIAPEVHIPLAREKIRHAHRILGESDWVETEPVGFERQPNFINGAFLIETDMKRSELKVWLRDVESMLGRIRTANRNGPRTIDLDLVVWDGEIQDSDFFSRDFLKRAVIQLCPGLDAD